MHSPFLHVAVYLSLLFGKAPSKLFLVELKDLGNVTGKQNGDTGGGNSEINGDKNIGGDYGAVTHTGDMARGA